MSLRNKIALAKANITHVVTVLQLERPDKELFATFKDHLVIGVHDVDDENLLEHFATTNAFIQSGLDQGGGVLVHWLVPLSLESFCPLIDSGLPWKKLHLFHYASMVVRYWNSRFP
jgi:hypothetical protein